MASKVLTDIRTLKALRLRALKKKKVRRAAEKASVVL